MSHDHLTDRERVDLALEELVELFTPPIKAIVGPPFEAELRKPLTPEQLNEIDLSGIAGISILAEKTEDLGDEAAVEELMEKYRARFEDGVSLSEEEERALSEKAAEVQVAIVDPLPDDIIEEQVLAESYNTARYFITGWLKLLQLHATNKAGGQDPVLRRDEMDDQMLPVSLDAELASACFSGYQNMMSEAQCRNVLRTVRGGLTDGRALPEAAETILGQHYDITLV